MKNQIVKTISLILTQNCNLSCTYCYEFNKSNRKMSFDTAICIIEKFLSDQGDDFDECVIDFYGGEPFLNFPLMKSICEYVWSKKWEKPCLFFATTNGTLIHGDIREWLLKNKETFHVALSLDGTKEMQDINRSNSFSKIDVHFFKDTWLDLEVKMTISKETLPYLAEGVMFLHSLNFKIRNSLAYGIDWSEPENIQILSRELITLIDFYLENPDVKPCSLMNLKMEEIGNSERKWCRVGSHMIVFDVDGKNYPCHGFLPTAIGKKKAETSRTLNFNLGQNLIDPKCDRCILNNLCPTCYASNYKETNNIANRNQQHCNFNKVKALACTCLQAKKMLSDQHLRGLSTTDRLIIESIIQIQNQIPNLQLKEIFTQNIFQLSEKEIFKLTNMLSNSSESESHSVVI